jgi:hypothetical protein
MTTDLDDDRPSTIRSQPSPRRTEREGTSEYGTHSDGELRHSARIRDRNTALGFAVLGGLCFLTGLALPDSRQLLFALAGIGGFAAVLTHAIAPDRTLDARDGRRVYETAAGNLAQLLDLTGAESGARERYVPEVSEGRTTVHLTIASAPDRDLELEPIGRPFVAELDRTLEHGLASRPDRLTEQLTDALVARFEFATRADSFVDVDGRRIDVTVSESAFGPLDAFDHPVVSVLGVGLAAGLERPVDVPVSGEGDHGERIVTFRWDEPEKVDGDADDTE